MANPFFPQGMQGFGAALTEASPLLLSMAQGMRSGQGPYAYMDKGLAAMMQKQKDREEAAKRAQGDEQFQSLLGGMMTPQSVGFNQPPRDNFAPESLGNDTMAALNLPPQNMGEYGNALKSIESSHNYRALGPVTASGDRAYGAYQVMGKNIPSWTKTALGHEMTPEQFLADDKAQDKVFDHYFGQSVQQYGNPQDAASVWFTGKSLAEGGNRSDGYNTGNQYVDKFNAALNGGGATMVAQNTQAQADLARLYQIYGSGSMTDQQLGVVEMMIQQKQAEMQPAAGMQPTDDMREFDYAQENPAFANFLNPADKNSAAEEQIQRLVEIGIPRDLAIGITDGRYVLSRDPTTGAATVIDMANAPALVGQQPTVTPPLGDEAITETPLPPPASAMPDNVDYSAATGTEGMVKNLANTAAEILGLGLISPNNERATQALKSLSRQTMIELAKDVGGRPSNFLMEQIQDLTTSPNSPFQGPGRSADRLNQMRAFVDQKTRENADVIANAHLYTPAQVADARANMATLETLRADYDVVIGSFGVRTEGANKTSTGIEWSIAP